LTREQANLGQKEVNRDRRDLESNFLQQEVKICDNLVSPLLCLKPGLGGLVMLEELQLLKDGL
jgi:hypothetical protein